MANPDTDTASPHLSVTIDHPGLSASVQVAPNHPIISTLWSIFITVLPAILPLFQPTPAPSPAPPAPTPPAAS